MVEIFINRIINREWCMKIFSLIKNEKNIDFSINIYIDFSINIDISAQITEARAIKASCGRTCRAPWRRIARPKGRWE
jgi:hypothetical protein